ncbi:Glycosyl transferase family 2 [Fibrobacter intestinalis]|uniref:Glycosyl transferase family 2 n=2 Tax=Fibrobacter intestinalis TaxID=28122 RepID=A0A1M6ULK8_9BACT|nr:Glycosyl transferase family 2 [Fibrobacter intestinalis]
MMGERMKKYPPYSVLLSVYNKENPDYLEESLNCVFSQNIFPDEVILIEDGNLTDGLYAVINRYKEKFPKTLKIFPFKNNRGLGLCLRDGVTFCENELIARMDSDDICSTNRLEKQLEKFLEDPNLDVVGCWEYEFWNTKEKPFACHKVPEYHTEIFKFMKKRCALLHPTVVFKKTAVMRAGNYRSCYLFEDYDLFCRMLISGSKTYNIQQALYSLRVNPELFRRRGGLKYAKTLLGFKFGLYRKGFISLGNFMIGGFGHAAVCLLPNSLRVLFYKIFLR